MFLSTLRRLTVLNSLVFLLIFVAFNAILYGYISFRLFDKIDETMRTQANSFRIVNGRAAPLGRPLFDPRIFLVFRTTDGRIIMPNPFRSDLADDVAEIAATITPGELKNKEYEGHVYRILSVPYRHQENVWGSERGVSIQSVVAVSIVDSEVELLNRVFWIIVFGGIFSMACIILAGYLLAKRAMIPIEAAWERQQQFVSDASHELRTPIAVIKGYVNMLDRWGKNDKAILEESITAIKNETDNMQDLIEKLLFIARSDKGNLDYTKEDFKISTILNEIEKETKMIDANHKLYFKFYDDANIYGDIKRIKQAIRIIIDNSIKYTPAGGYIMVSGFLQDDYYIIKVEDTGIGIEKKDLNKIFDRLYRAEQSRSREIGGHGLGLSIAKIIIIGHKGKIKVKSAPGRGTEFSIMIPYII